MISVGQYLSSKGFEWRERHNEAVMNCPFCGEKDRKFAVNLQTGAFNCFHLNTCGIKGSFIEFQRKLGDEPEYLVNNGNFFNLKQKTYKVPEEKQVGISDPVMDYLHNRGFSDNTIKRFKIKGEGSTVILPYYREGRLINNKYRDVIDKKKMRTEKESEQILFNRDNITGDRLYICEGEFDAMAFFEYGINAASVPMGAGNHTWLESEWDYIERFKAIYFVFDQDQAGRKGVSELVIKLGSWRCRNVNLPYKDLNDCLKNKVSKDEILICLDNAQDFLPANLAMPSDFKDEIVELFDNPRSLDGTETAWSRLNKILKGWRLGELTVWSGRSGAGKSTILNQHLIDIISKGIKVCIASLEMPPARYLRWAVIQQLEVNSPSKADIEYTLRYFDNKMFVVNILDEVKPKDLLDIFEYAARRYNAKHFIIDSLMKVSLKLLDELNAQKDFTSQLTSFAKKFNAHVHLVAHPRKGMKDSDVPGKVDIRGSSHITDLAHNVIVLFRPESEEKEKSSKIPDMLLMVKKNREFGIEGMIKMKFDPETKKYSEW